MTTRSDAADIGRLLAWAARPKETPARNDDYHRLISRYRNDPDFAQTTDAVFAGAGMHLNVDEREGAIVVAAPDSPLRLTLGDVMKRASSFQRAAIGAAILAIASTAYPEPSMLDDPDRMAVFTTRSVVELLDRAAASYADNSQSDGSVDDDLAEAWRAWNQLAPGRPNAQRHSAADRFGLVIRVCKVLVDAGFLTSRGDLEGGAWLARPRFRHAVTSMAEDSDLYIIVNGLTETENTDEHT